jgi:hypothetical protein
MFCNQQADRSWVDFAAGHQSATNSTFGVIHRGTGTDVLLFIGESFFDAVETDWAVTAALTSSEGGKERSECPGQGPAPKFDGVKRKY